jgi:hypothetical protein
MADVHSLQKIKEIELRMQFEALLEDAKQRVLRIQEAAIERQKQQHHIERNFSPS